MPKSMQLALFASLLLLTPAHPYHLAGDNDVPQLSVYVRAQSIQPAGLPILITLNLTNVGTKPYYYLDQGTPAYPGGSHFLAVITDDSGTVRQAQMSNELSGAWGGRGGSRVEVKPLHGQAIDVPVCIDPLVPGSYRIEVKEAESVRDSLIVKGANRVRISVRKDSELAQKWEKDLLGRIRKGERFAQYVAETYASSSLIDLLLNELLSDDRQIVERAAFPLSRARKLPASSVPMISRAMHKHLAAAQNDSDVRVSILRMLADMLANVGSDEALEPVLALARTRLVRGESIWPLGGFSQEKATQELRRFLQDENKDLQFHAARRLSERKDPEGLEVLLNVANDPKSPWRRYSFDALLKYRDDPRVVPAIKRGLDDPAYHIRRSAESALGNLAGQK